MRFLLWSKHQCDLKMVITEHFDAVVLDIGGLVSDFNWLECDEVLSH